mgnify:CR=1 FL=1
MVKKGLGISSNTLIIKAVLSLLLPAALVLFASCDTSQRRTPEAGYIPAAGHENGWLKRGSGPVLGSPELGTCFDVNVIPYGSAKYTTDVAKEWNMSATPSMKAWNLNDLTYFWLSVKILLFLTERA